MSDDYKVLACITALFTVGFTAFEMGKKQAPPPLKEVVEKPIATTQEVTHTQTVVKVVEKEKPSDADLQIKDKYTYKANINGKEVELVPSNKESFEYGKDAVKIDREVEVSYKIDNKPLEPSWSLGVGIDNDAKPAMMVSARLRKSPFSMWGVSNFNDKHMVGLSLNGSFK